MVRHIRGQRTVEKEARFWPSDGLEAAKRDMLTGGTCKITGLYSQGRRLITSEPPFPTSPFHCRCVSLYARAWSSQLLFANWCCKIPRPCWHTMTNVWTLTGKPAVISKTFSEIMVAEGGENARECKLQLRQWAGKRTALLMTTLCAFVTEVLTLVSISQLIS